jgi:N-carbamoylputrescine amidase
VLICWDQWFPEGARLTAMQGAEILFYPTAIGWHPAEKAEYGEAQHESWEVIQRSHAIANGCYVCVPNRIGHEFVLDPNGKPVSKDGIEFWGQSFVAGARTARSSEASRLGGPRRGHGGRPRPEPRSSSARTHWPFLRDRRIDAYGGITERGRTSATRPLIEAAPAKQAV